MALFNPESNQWGKDLAGHLKGIVDRNDEQNKLAITKELEERKLRIEEDRNDMLRQQTSLATMLAQNARNTATVLTGSDDDFIASSTGLADKIKALNLKSNFDNSWDDDTNAVNAGRILTQVETSLMQAKTLQEVEGVGMEYALKVKGNLSNLINSVGGWSWFSDDNDENFQLKQHMAAIDAMYNHKVSRLQDIIGKSELGAGPYAKIQASKQNTEQNNQTKLRIQQQKIAAKKE